MRKGLSVSIAVTFLIIVSLFSACSDNASDDSKGDRPYEGKTLNIIMAKDPGTEDFKDRVIPEFEDETGMEVNVELLPESGYGTKLNLALSNGKSNYDVITTGVKNWSQLVSSDWLEPLDEFYDNSPEEYTSGFSNNLLNNFKDDGAIYSMPYNVGADLLFYNKKMFEEAGLDPEDPPDNMEELLQYAKKLHKPKNDQSGFVARGTRKGNQNSFSWIMMWLKNGGSWGDDPEDPQYIDILNKPEAIKTLEQYKELMLNYGPEGIQSYGFNEAQLAMQQSEAAMWLGAAQLGPALENEEQSKIAGDVGYHKMSGLSGDDSYISGAVWGLSIVKTSQNKDAAWELIKYLTSEKISSEQVISGVLGSPGRSDTLKNEKVKENIDSEYADALADAIEYTYPNYSPVIPEGKEIRGTMSTAISKVLSGDADPKGALEEANKEIKEILN